MYIGQFCKTKPQLCFFFSKKLFLVVIIIVTILLFILTKITSKYMLVRSKKLSIYILPQVFILVFLLVVVTCYDPGNLTHGFQSGYDFTFPETIHYWCDEGYNLIGSENRTCQESGRWSGITPSCDR